MQATKINAISEFRKINRALFMPDNHHIVASNAKKGRDGLRQFYHDAGLPEKFRPLAKRALLDASASELHKVLLFGKHDGSKLTVGEKVEVALDLANAIVKEYPYTLGYPFSLKQGQVEFMLTDKGDFTYVDVYAKPVKVGLGEGSLDSLLYSAASNIMLHREVKYAFTSIHMAFSDLVKELGAHLGVKEQQESGNVIEMKPTGTG